MRGVATLIVNPAAGRARLLRAQLPAMIALLATYGYEACVLYTTQAANSGRDLARQSVGSALVIACGGDGTVHDVLQGFARTGVPLGVLPLGTANALARNLGLPLDPLAALTRLLSSTPRRVPLGEITTTHGTRLFTVVAGCGPDGALAHTLPPAWKRRLGRSAYYSHAARLFLTRRLPKFQVDYLLAGDITWHRTTAVAMMTSRVPSLGGLFSGLTRASALTDPVLKVQLLKAPAKLSLPVWFLLSRLRLPNPLLTMLDVVELRCTPLSATPVYAQADAEPAGMLPLHVRILADALTLLMP